MQVKVSNAGKGKLTFSVPAADASLIAQVDTGVAPGTITFMMEPGRTGVTRQYGTNLYSGGGATNSGTALNLNLASPQAINVPNTIRILMNNRQSDQRGVVYPIPTVPTNAEGLQDILIDEARNAVTYFRFAAEWVTPVETDSFAGFCDACGGFRTHRRLCPRDPARQKQAA